MTHTHTHIPLFGVFGEMLKFYFPVEMNKFSFEGN